MTKIEEYPIRAIREALINAVAHRNYTISADVKIIIYPDRLEIKNPGSLMPGADISDPEHIPRNPSLSNQLFDSGYIGRYRFGIRMIEEETLNHPFCSVEFKVSPASFTVIFRKEISSALEEMDNRILKQVQVPTKSREIASRLNVSKNTVLKRIDKREKLGLIEKKGSGPHTSYVVKRRTFWELVWEAKDSLDGKYASNGYNIGIRRYFGEAEVLMHQPKIL